MEDYVIDSLEVLFSLIKNEQQSYSDPHSI